MATHYRTQGFIFKKVDRGEADQLFTIYTKDFGRLEILGKAIRKIKSKLRSGAELFYLSEIEFIQGKTYKTLIDAILIDKFDNLRKDLKRLKIADKISEVLDNLIKGQEPDEKIWNLISETFQKLNNQQFTISNQQLLYYYFFWNLLSILGYQLDLFNCTLCQKKLEPGKLFFSPKDGGLVCDKCQNLVKLIKKVEPDTVKILRISLQKDWKTIRRLKVEKSHLEGLKEISQNQYLFMLEDTPS